jgi:hypothetical protein
MEYFIAQARIVLPVLGVNLLRSTAATPSADPSTATGNDTPEFVLTQPRDHVDGTAQEVDGEFTVRAGSRARRTWASKTNVSYASLRQRLESDGTLVASTDGQTMAFAHDQVFASPSAAAAVCLGRPSNGRVEWKVKGTGLAYGEWLAQKLEGLVDLETSTSPGT